MRNKDAYKQRLEKLRIQLALERSLKKNDNEHLAKQIKSTTLPAAKANYRKQKMTRAAAHDSRIEAIMKEIENLRALRVRKRKLGSKAAVKGQR